MDWWKMPETTERERAEKEIAECEYCMEEFITTMDRLIVPKRDWGDNPIVLWYMERIELAKDILDGLG